MTKRRASALIVASPGEVRDGFEALLAAIAQIDVVGRAQDRRSALNLVAEHRPALLLLDFDLPGHEIPELLERVKAEVPEIQCIALVDGAKQQRAARAAGADVVLVKGSPARKLSEAVKGLVSCEGTRTS